MAVIQSKSPEEQLQLASEELQCAGIVGHCYEELDKLIGHEEAFKRVRDAYNLMFNSTPDQIQDMLREQKREEYKRRKKEEKLEVDRRINWQNHVQSSNTLGDLMSDEVKAKLLGGK